jgi:tRNA(Ile)-lysidine synthase
LPERNGGTLEPAVKPNDSLHPLESRILQFIHEKRLIVEGRAVLAAVSGGPDSVALLRVLVSLRGRLEIGGLYVAHFNHQLRGAEADADAEWVRELAEKQGLEFEYGTADVAAYAKRRSLSLEMAARQCRRGFLLEIGQRRGASAVAFGHNADDQAEEVLLRLLRGTGPAGMAGMEPRTGDGLVRPLLGATRREIVDYLADIGQSYREDPSNREPFCLRNRLRLEVMPLLKRHFNPRATETLCRHADLAAEEERFWAGLVDVHWREIVQEQSGGRVVLAAEKLRTQPAALRRRLYRRAAELLFGELRGIFAVHLKAVDRLVTEAQSGRSLDLPHGMRVMRDGDRLVFRVGVPEPVESPDLVMPGPGSYRVGELVVEVSELPAEPAPDPGSACRSPAGASSCGRFPPGYGAGDYPPGSRVSSSTADAGRPAVAGDPPTPSRWWSVEARLDADCVHWPLVLRTRRPGDRFQPLGMTGTRKLQDFFTDAKIPLEDRDRIPVLCDSKQILWVAGYRIDHRVRLEESTRRVLRIRITALPPGCALRRSVLGK